MSRPDDIVGYQYRADVYCPDCTLTVYRETRKAAGAWMDDIQPPTRLYPDVDAILAEYADWRGIQRADEWTFDSDDFPKVVFRDAVDGYVDEQCGRCGTLLDIVSV